MKKCICVLFHLLLAVSLFSLCSCGGPLYAIYVALEEGKDEKRDPVVLRVPADYPTIQAAVDAALKGDTVLVADGTYTGTGNKNIDFGARAITVRSENGPWNCIIDCETGGRGFYFPHLYSVVKGQAVLQGFTIKNGNVFDQGGAIFCGGNFSPWIINCILTDNYANDGGAIHCDYGASPFIANCTMTGNSAFIGGAIRCNGSSATIANCTITNNSAIRHAGAIFIWEGASPTITNCLITDNTVAGSYSDGSGGAISCRDSSVAVINCTISNNSCSNTGGGSYRGGGIYYENGSNATLDNTILWGNSATNGGNQIYVPGGAIVTLNYCDYANGIDDVQGIGMVIPNNCMNVDPQFANPGGGDYHLQAGSPCIDAGSNSLVPSGTTTDPEGVPRILDGDRDSIPTVDMGVYEYRTRIYVDGSSGFDFNDGSSWANALRTIQRGLDLAQDWWFVIVADGTYTGYGNRELDFSGKAISLESQNGSANCTIDCQSSGRGFYFQNGETAGSVVNGFTIVNGNVSDDGGGILCEGASPSISNCEITSCWADQGGGIACNNASPAVTNCLISNNSASRNGGGVFCEENSSPRINGGIMSGNWAGYGGAVASHPNCGPTIDNCTITGNSAMVSGGIHCHNWSMAWVEVTISNCTITNNSANGGSGGGISCHDARPTIAYCVITNNSTTGYGGGIYSYNNASPRIVNCKITDNSSSSDGAGIFCDGTSSTITNCTIAYNDSSAYGGGVFFINSTPALNNTILWGNTASSGNQIYIYDGPTTVYLNNCDYANNFGDVMGAGVTAPNNCINADPLFVNPAGGDYHLQSGSPCTNMGGDALVPAGTTIDLDGNPRVQGSAVDIGAYEQPVVTFARTWGGTNYEYIEGVAVDSSGNIYCASYTDGFGAGSQDALLLKYDSSGTLQWTKTWGGAGYDYLVGIAVDSSGNIYCAGKTDSFGAGGGDALLLKFNSSGTLQWAKTWGGAGNDYLYGIAVDSSGNIYCAGITDSFGAGEFDALLLKYDSSGTLLWTKTWGGTDWDLIQGVAVDSSGNIYCAGYTDSFGAMGWDMLLLKYNSSGVLQWAKTWGGARTYGIAVDSAGNIYCAGETYSFGAGVNDALLLKYDISGTLLWAKTWGGAGWDEIWGVAVDSSGNIYCAGETDGFGAGGDDALLLKYDNSGTLQWAKTWGGASDDWISSLAVDSGGDVHLGGGTESYTGTWQTIVAGSVTSPAGTQGTPAGSQASPAGTWTSPTGTEGSPAGNETGAGNSDALLLKNW